MSSVHSSIFLTYDTTSAFMQIFLKRVYFIINVCMYAVHMSYAYVTCCKRNYSDTTFLYISRIVLLKENVLVLCVYLFREVAIILVSKGKSTSKDLEVAKSAYKRNFCSKQQHEDVNCDLKFLLSRELIRQVKVPSQQRWWTVWRMADDIFTIWCV